MNMRVLISSLEICYRIVNFICSLSLYECVILFLFQAAGVPVDFETFFFSEVHHTMSAPLEDVAKSIATNGICLKV
jgi:hypothetical protein